MSKSAAQTPQIAPRSGGPKARAKTKVRINLRAVLILGVLAVALVPAYFALQAMQDLRVKSPLLQQARDYLDAKPPKPDLAIKYLDRYLELAPGDPVALGLKAKLLADSARDYAEIGAAIGFVDYVVRTVPEGEGRQEARRHLIGLYLRKGQFVRQEDVAEDIEHSGIERVGYRTAEVIARELIAQDVKAGRSVAQDHRLLGRVLLGVDILGDPKALDEAVRELEEAVKLDPTDVFGAAQLADLAAGRKKQPARADAVLDALLKAVPTAQTRLARFDHYSRLGPPEKARAELRDAVQAFPHEPQVLLSAAQDALGRNEAGAARAYLEALPESQRNLYAARFLRGILELRENRNDDAVADWRQGLLLTSGNNADLSFYLARVLLELGRVDEARPLMEQVRRLTGGDKPSPLYQFLEALALIQDKQPAAALEILERIRPAFSKMDKSLVASLNMTIADCYEKVRDEPRALAAYREAAASPGVQTNAYLRIARLVTSISGPDAGSKELEAALAKAPGDFQILMTLGQVRLQQRRWPEAKDLLDRAARVAPGAPGLILLQAEYLTNTGHTDDAVKLLGRAAQEIDRKDISLWLAYSNGLVRQGRVTDALQVLDRASGPDAAGDRALIRVARARLLQQAGRGRQARQELDRDVDSLPPADRPDLLRARAEMLTVQGDRPAALAALRQWSAMAPQDPQPALAMLDSALATKDEADAAAAIKALGAIRQADGAYEFIGLAYEALRAALAATAADRPASLDAADRLVGKVLERAPKLPQGHMMRGLILEERAKPEGLTAPARDAMLDSAITSYRTALDNGGTSAIPRLVELYTRRKRSADLTILRRRVAANATFDRMSIEAALRFGLNDEAQEIARKVVEGAPEDLDARRVQADVLKRLGKPDDAEDVLRDLAHIHPDQPGPWLQLLVFQVGRNRKEAAAKTIDQIVRNVKGERPDFVHAQAYWLAGDLEHAGEAFRKSLQAWPNDPAVARKAADFFEATGKSAEAEATLRRALKDDPAASWAARKLALILSARATSNIESWREAAKLVAAPADASAGEMPEDRLARAIVLSRSPDPATSAGAVPLLRALKDDMPQSTPIGREARERLTRYFLDADRSQEAWELAANANDQESDSSPDIVALHAETLLGTKKLDEAEAEIRRLEALEPKGLRVEVLRSRLLAARGKPEEAEAALEEAYDRRAQSPDAAGAAASVLTALARMDRLDAAERVARREAEARPGNSWMLARVLDRRRRPAEAVAACIAAVKAGSARSAIPLAMAMAIAPNVTPQTVAGVDDVLGEALKQDPKSSELLMQRAQIRHIQGRFDDEVSIYRDLQADHPADHTFLNNWAWTLSESLHKPDEALKLVQEAIRRSGRFPVYLDTEGVILGRMGRHDQAIAVLTESAPGLRGGQGFLHLAQAQHQAGQDAPARLSLDQARAAGLKPENLDAEARAQFEALDAALPPRAAAPAHAPTPARPRNSPAPAAPKAAAQPKAKVGA